jgi:hypothetical protein
MLGGACFGVPEHTYCGSFVPEAEENMDAWARAEQLMVRKSLEESKRKLGLKQERGKDKDVSSSRSSSPSGSHSRSSGSESSSTEGEGEDDVPQDDRLIRAAVSAETIEAVKHSQEQQPGGDEDDLPQTSESEDEDQDADMDMPLPGTNNGAVDRHRDRDRDRDSDSDRDSDRDRPAKDVRDYTEMTREEGDRRASDMDAMQDDERATHVHVSDADHQDRQEGSVIQSVAGEESWGAGAGEPRRAEASGGREVKAHYLRGCAVGTWTLFSSPAWLRCWHMDLVLITCVVSLLAHGPCSLLAHGPCSHHLRGCAVGTWTLFSSPAWLRCWHMDLVLISLRSLEVLVFLFCPVSIFRCELGFKTIVVLQGSQQDMDQTPEL